MNKKLTMQLYFLYYSNCFGGLVEFSIHKMVDFGKGMRRVHDVSKVNSIGSVSMCFIWSNFVYKII